MFSTSRLCVHVFPGSMELSCSTRNSVHTAVALQDFCHPIYTFLETQFSVFFAPLVLSGLVSILCSHSGSKGHPHVSNVDLFQQEIPRACTTQAGKLSLL